MDGHLGLLLAKGLFTFPAPHERINHGNAYAGVGLASQGQRGVVVTQQDSCYADHMAERSDRVVRIDPISRNDVLRECEDAAGGMHFRCLVVIDRTGLGLIPVRQSEYEQGFVGGNEPAIVAQRRL